MTLKYWNHPSRAIGKSDKMESINKSKIIAVEGSDEVNFFNALLEKLNISDIQILNFEGKTKFSSRIKSIVNIPGFDKVKMFALIRDADNKPPKSAFDSILSSFKAAGLPLPSEINSFTKTKLAIGIFIMPGDAKQGMLEDLCIRSIEQYPIYNCINKFFECCDKKPKNESKARILCYLATKNPLVNSLGLGAVKGHWDFDSDNFIEIKGFFTKMQ